MNDVLERTDEESANVSPGPVRAGERWGAAVRRALGSRRRLVGGGVGALLVLVAVVLLLGGGGGRRSGDQGAAPVGPSVTARSGGSADAGSAGAPVSGESASGSAAGGTSGGSAADGAGAASAAEPAKPSTASSAPGQGSASVPALPKAAPRVVQTGDMNLLVKRGAFDAAVDRLHGLATGLGGFVAAEKTERTGNAPTGSLTLRVPSDAFDKLVDGVRGLGRVTSADSSSTDVTGDYVDLQARIDALKATRQAYLQLLSKATTVGDTLSVQQNVTAVQTQIEQLEGQRQVLADQSDLATLIVEVGEQGAPAVEPAGPKHENGFASAAHRAWHRFARGLQAVLAGLGTVALVLVVVAALIGLGLLGRALLRRRTGTRTPPAPDPTP